MGHKDTIKAVLQDSYGYEDENFKWDLQISKGEDQIKTLTPQKVKARFIVYKPLNYKFKELVVDVTVTVWGDVKFKSYGKLDDIHKEDYRIFMTFVKKHVVYDVKRALNKYKAQLSKAKAA